MSRSILLTSAQKHARLTVAITIWVSEFVFASTLMCRWFSGAFAASQIFWFGAAMTIVMAVVSLTARALAHENGQPCAGCCSKAISTVIADLLTIIPPLLCGIAMLPFQSAKSISFLIALGLVICVAIYFVAETSHQNMRYFLNVILWGQSAIIKHDDEIKSETDNINSSLEDKLLQQAISLETSSVINSEPLLQSITRKVDGGGREFITGQLQAKIEVGTRQTTLHIPFTPPFQSKPEVTCELQTDRSAKVVPTAIYTYGTRLEIRLTEPVEEETMFNITFSAMAE